jgi:hypothetical protein
MQNVLNNSVAKANVFAILMDSDTLFSNALSAQQIFDRYDCAIEAYDAVQGTVAGSRSLLMSTETSCWIGQYCTPANISHWYSTTVPSAAPFANSGVMMGRMTELTAMLEHVIAHQDDYFLIAPHRQNRVLFDDQFAYADYCLRVMPRLCALDYHQQLSASFALTLQDTLQPTSSNNNWPFVCKTLSGAISYNCPDSTRMLFHKGYFMLDAKSCGIERRWQAGMRFETQLGTLCPTPLIYHGNGAGKHTMMALGGGTMRCILESTYDGHTNKSISSLTESEYMSETSYSHWKDTGGFHGYLGLGHKQGIPFTHN